MDYPVISALYDVGNSHIRTVVCYSTVDSVFAAFYPHNDGTYRRVSASIFSVSGTSLSIGATQALYAPDGSFTYTVDAVYDEANNCFIFGYIYPGENNFNLRKTTISSGTFNTSAIVSAGAIGASGDPFLYYHTKMVYDYGEEKTSVYFKNYNTNVVSCVVASASSTDVSVSSAVTVATTEMFSSCYDSNSGKHVVIYPIGSTLKCKIGTISGGVINFSSEISLDSDCSSGGGLFVSCTYDEDKQRVVSCHNLSTNVIRFSSFDISTGAVSDKYTTDWDYGSTSSVVLATGYDKVIKKVCCVCNVLSKMYSATVTISSGSISVHTPSIISSSNIASNCITFGDAADGTVVSSWNYSGSNTDRIFFAQLDDPAPINFWTNFSGQSEIL